MKCSANMVFRSMLFVFLIWNFGYSQTPRSFHANLIISKQSANQYIMPPIHGKVAFTRLGRIKVITLGDTVSQDFGLNGLSGTANAKWVRWNPAGTKLAVLTSDSKVYVMDAVKNASLTLLVSSVDNGANCGIEFHTNGHEILYAKSRIIYAVDIDTKVTRMLVMPPPASLVPTPDCDGEIGISANGNRMVWRGTEKGFTGYGTTTFVMPHKVDFALNYDSLYLIQNYSDPNNVKLIDPNGCSTNISPDGSMVMNNTRAHGSLAAHKSIMIWKFEATGALVKEIIIPTGIPDPLWDNQHWSNHNDWIAAKGDGGGLIESYVTNRITDSTYRVTWEGSTDYPDLWVDTAYIATSVKTINSSSSTSGRTGIQLTYANGFPQLGISITGHHDFRVYNILGQLLQSQNGYGPSSYSFPNLRSGLYFIQVRTQQGTAVQKMAIIR